MGLRKTCVFSENGLSFCHSHCMHDDDDDIENSNIFIVYLYILCRCVSLSTYLSSYFMCALI